MMKKIQNGIIATMILFSLWANDNPIQAQGLRIPQNQNIGNSVGRRLGVTEMDIKWNAPGVKGREGKIWGTTIAHYGFMVLGFGSNVESPWRAGADEGTTMSFSTDVRINGQPLAAGTYNFFIAVYPDSCVLIFNKNTTGWGSYFYDKSKDVLRVTTIQQKNQPQMQERLAYQFDKQTDQTVEVALLWEYWKIPFTVSVDTKATTLANIKAQMIGALGFDPPSLIAAARWCLQNDVNLTEAAQWIDSAVDPNLGGTQTFNALSTKSKLLSKLGKADEAASTMQKAIDAGTAIELHQYGRQLLAEKKTSEAMSIFEKNYKKYNGAWPTNVGLMRGYSASGDLKKALESAKSALQQAPDELNKKSLMDAIKQLESGKAL